MGQRRIIGLPTGHATVRASDSDAVLESAVKLVISRDFFFCPACPADVAYMAAEVHLIFLILLVLDLDKLRFDRCVWKEDPPVVVGSGSRFHEAELEAYMLMGSPVFLLALPRAITCVKASSAFEQAQLVATKAGNVLGDEPW
jgi:hypothetical protein